MSNITNANRDTVLVTTEWLEEHLDDPGIRIVDARNGDNYAKSHIVGAVVYDGTPFLRDDGDVIGASPFAALMSRIGVDHETTVVTYDDGNNLFAARLWWVLNYYGHTQVKILDGGWDLWAAEGRPVAVARSLPIPARFEAHPHEVWIASSEYVKASIGHADRVILDVRGNEEWTRTESTGQTPPGHIPGAVHLVWTDVIDPESKRFKPAPDLRRMFAYIGVSQEKEVITYCQGGVRAAHTLLALKLADFDNVRNYEGSWAAWSRSSLPVEHHSAALAVDSTSRT